ncbi:MAG TPA: type II toxin-antitoxin system RelE/ParE family toxin [Caulobacteraceae bacterium]|jgi:toxin ParE1/3/4|nr:type II toxin-antitoxin system RelE/ParE family toxin [Caulobacteraceae bacterium]
MADYRLTEAAETDIIEILAWSEAQFGEAARQRYERLIVTALMDIAATPVRPGSIARPELGEGVRSWHLRGSRTRARGASGIVQRPRHFLIYRQLGALVVVARVLHDVMELERHLRAPDNWE